MTQSSSQPLDPHKTMCVCKHNGKEIGRVAATAANAEAYLTELARTHDGMTVDYVEDPDAAMISSLFSRPR